MSNIRGVSILGGTVTATLSGTSTVSVSGFESDAITQLKNIRADEIVTKDGQNSFRVEDSATHRLLYEILNENKKQTQLLEFIYGEEL